MSEAFRIGIELALVDAGFRAALAQITASLFKVRQHQKEIEKGFEAWGAKARLLGGGAAMFGGYEMAKGIMSVADASKQLLNIQNQLVQLGMSENKVLELRNKYYNEMNKVIPTATVQQYLKTIGELRSITGADDAGTDKAAKIAEKALQAEALLNNMAGKRKPMEGEGTTEYFKILRAAEMAGIATKPEELAKFTDEVVKIVSAFHGKLSAQDVLGLARQGGSAWKQLVQSGDQDTLAKIAVLAADLGGARAGTTLKGIQMAQAGSANISSQQKMYLEQAGLLDPEKVHKAGLTGYRMDIGALKGGLEYQGRLPEWFEKVITPAFRDLAKKKKAEGLEGTEDQIFEDLISKAFRNRDQQRFGSAFSDPGFMDQVSKDLGLRDAVKKMGERFASLINENPEGVEQAFKAQRDSMWEAIGAPIMQAAIPVMQAVTAVFQEMGRMANANPEVIQGIGIGIAAIAAALMVSGIGLVLSFIGPAGVLVGAITAISAAVAAFLPNAAKEFIAYLQALASLDLKGVVIHLVGFKEELEKGIQDALQAVVDSINAWIKKQFTFSGPGGGGPPAGMEGMPEGNTGPMGPKPQSFGGWEPSNKQTKVVQINHQAQLDGEVMARSIAKYLAETMEHPRQAPYFDGMESYTAPDYQPIST